MRLGRGHFNEEGHLVLGIFFHFAVFSSSYIWHYLCSLNHSYNGQRGFLTQGVIGMFQGRNNMVRWISFFLLLISLSAQAKRFIVHHRAKNERGRAGSFAFTTEKRSIITGASEAAVKSLFSDEEVVSIEEDIILEATLEPGDVGSGDTFYNQQWHYFETSGIELPSAWDITTGSQDIVVAIVDTGMTNHPDLQSKVIQGADLVSESAMAGDGDGRDNDATDEGDWITFSDSCFQGMNRDSSWHGTHVAGTVAAHSDNGIGVTGVSWNSKILPVRVLGKCGGYLSDIADGVRWAAGGSVAGVTNNQNPADVINLSLGGRGNCTTTMQSAIDFAVSQGAVVVVASGNDDQNLDFSSYVPANCRNVINVGASNRSSNRSYFSNYGSSVDIMAPGGDFSASVFSTSNDGTTVANRASYRGMSGTSMAAPHVAGVVALIKSVAPNLFPAQIENIIKESAKFVNCDESNGCGAGMIDAYSALRLAEITVPDGSFQGTEPINPTPDTPGAQRLIASDDGGGMCGSVAFVEGGNPPKGGLGAFVLSLLLGLILSLVQKATQRKF